MSHKSGLQKNLRLGNLNALRDWGHAKDYIEMQWLMLQQEKPDDYVIATGQQKSVRQFIEAVAELEMEISWRGDGVQEVGLWEGREIIKVDDRYYRPTEVESLLVIHQKQKIYWLQLKFPSATCV